MGRYMGNHCTEWPLWEQEFQSTSMWRYRTAYGNAFSKYRSCILFEIHVLLVLMVSQKGVSQSKPFLIRSKDRHVPFSSVPLFEEPP